MATKFTPTMINGNVVFMMRPEPPKCPWGNAWDYIDRGIEHKASCKMCGYPTDGDRLCDACKQAVSQERHSDLQRLLSEHQVDCVEDLPKGVLEAHQRRHEVKL